MSIWTQRWIFLFDRLWAQFRLLWALLYGGKERKKENFFPFLPIWGAGVNFAAFAFGGTDRGESGKSGLLTSSFLPSGD